MKRIKLNVKVVHPNKPVPEKIKEQPQDIGDEIFKALKKAEYATNALRRVNIKLHRYDYVPLGGGLQIIAVGTVGELGQECRKLLEHLKLDTDKMTT